jgi:hypothetical protein
MTGTALQSWGHADVVPACAVRKRSDPKARSEISRQSIVTNSFAIAARKLKGA